MPCYSPSLPPSLPLSLFLFPSPFLHIDINKFLWMVRIGGSTEKGRHIKEADYFTPQGEFRVDREGSPILLNCLMYKMCYYRFGQVYTEQGTAICIYSCYIFVHAHKLGINLKCIIIQGRQSFQKLSVYTKCILQLTL